MHYLVMMRMVTHILCSIWWMFRKFRIANLTIETEALCVRVVTESLAYFIRVWEEFERKKKVQPVVKTDSKTFIAFKSSSVESSKG